MPINPLFFFIFFYPFSFPHLSCILSTEYMSHFELRDLKAFSVEPLLIYPTHYTGEPGYISDTETSTIWDDEAVATDWDRQHADRHKTEQQGRIRSVAQNSVTGDSPPPAARASRDELWYSNLRLEERDSCLVCHVHTANVMCTNTWKKEKTLKLQATTLYIQTHTHILTDRSSRLCCLMKRHWGEGEEETLGRGPAGLWQKFYLFSLCLLWACGDSYSI